MQEAALLIFVAIAEELFFRGLLFRAHSIKDEVVASELESKGFWHPYRLVFAEYKVIIFCFIAAIAGIGRYGLLTWIPTY